MSSTSAEIDAAKRMAARVEAGEQVIPFSSGRNTGGAGADQLTAKVPQQPAREIPKGTTTAGLNRENMAVVDSKDTVPIQRREIAEIVGLGQEHNLRKQFYDPTIRAEEQTALKDTEMTTAQKQTQLGEQQISDANRNAKALQVTALGDRTTAAKQTKVFGAEEGGDDVDGGNVDDAGESADVDNSDAVDSGNATTDTSNTDTGDATTADTTNTGDATTTTETTTTVVETPTEVSGNNENVEVGGDVPSDVAVTTGSAADPLLAKKGGDAKQ
jgi:hypothetical protein